MAADESRHVGPAHPHPGRRERKKAEVRQRISDLATALFLRDGFDQVSVSEIAAAADVARPTVFAHFPRKEDLFFDRYPEVAGQGIAGDTILLRTTQLQNGFQIVVHRFGCGGEHKLRRH